MIRQKWVVERPEWERLQAEMAAVEEACNACPDKAEEWRRLLDRAVDLVENEVRKGTFLEDVALKAESVLKPVASFLKKYTIHYVGHAHIDMNWMWPWQETVDISYNTFRTIIKLMDEYPSLKFLQSQASVYEAMAEYAPEVFGSIKEREKAGQWEVVANTWVEGDKNMASGEAQVRQILETKKYFVREFGFSFDRVKVDFEPDLFGHAWTVPQILSKSNIRYYYFCRGGKGPQLFWWEAPDGSRVLAYDDRRLWYLGPVEPVSQVKQTFAFSKETGLKDYLVVYGVGDHGGGPTRIDLEKIEAMKEWPVFPNVQFSSMHSYFELVEKNSDNLPVIREELNPSSRNRRTKVYPIHTGCYTSHGDIKYANRTAENLLSTSEALACLASKITEFAYPGEQIAKAWRRACFIQFHDILPGCGKPCTADYAQGLFQEISASAGLISERAINALEEKVDTRGEGKPLLVVNPLAWSRTDTIVATIYDVPNTVEELALYDEKGVSIPVQIVERGEIWGPVPAQSRTHEFVKIAFTATDVPGLGYRTYFVKLDESPAVPEVPVEAKIDGRISTKFYDLKLELRSGAVTSLVDKATGLQVVPEGERFGLLEIFKEAPHPASAWDIGQITGIEQLKSGGRVEIVESGPVRSVVRITHTYNESKIVVDMMCYHDVPRIDYHLSIDWLERGTPETDAPMLKASFPTCMAGGKALYEIPFAHIEREANDRDVVAQRWTALTSPVDQAFRGITLVNDCKYGHAATPNRLRITLLRSGYEPDPLEDVGHHEIRYGCYVNPSSWTPTKATRWGAEFNQPLMTSVASQHNGPLPKSGGYLSIGQNGVISAVKRAEDGDGIIMRIYDAGGEGGVVDIECNFDVRSYVETNLLEEPLGEPADIPNGRIRLDLKPFEIKTVKLV